MAVVGDARLVAEQVLGTLPKRPGSEKPFYTAANLASIAGFDIALDFEAAHTPRTVDPRALGVELDKLLPRERNIVYDAGNSLGMPYITIPTPGHLKMTSEFASIGLGFGAALGVAKGRPHVRKISVSRRGLRDGGGGFRVSGVYHPHPGRVARSRIRAGQARRSHTSGLQVNAEIAAPFMGEFAEFEARHQST
jgi:thiamine pyrophosphate-dependent acetolactate synthase large subunit-like protein